MSVKWNNDAVLPEARRAVMRGLGRWIGRVETEAVRLILETPKTGRVYRRRGVEHRASAPGQPPASDTGTLVNARRVDLFDATLRARLTFSTAYAAYLQFGTRKMEPRPWADVALANTTAAGLQDVREELQASFGSGRAT